MVRDNSIHLSSASMPPCYDQHNFYAQPNEFKELDYWVHHIKALGF